MKNPTGTDYNNLLLEEYEKSGSLSTMQMEQIRARIKESGINIIDAIQSLNLDSSNEIYQITANALEIPYIDLNHFEVAEEDINLIKRETAHRYSIIPLFRMDNTLSLGMTNPSNTDAIDQARQETSLDIEPCLVSRESLEKAISRYYPETESSLSKIVDGVDANQFQMFDLQDSTSIESENMAPIAKAFSEIVTRAVRMRASDIHIEPGKQVLQIRYRIDGILRDISELPIFIARPLISHIKVLSSLQITETRKPQDGRYQSTIDDKPIDMRVSVIPTIFGESVTIRLLAATNFTGSITDLGFSQKNLKLIQRILSKPWGMVLASGPTGSGKTTTLFALLDRVKSRDKKIITVEDPVEYKFEDIRQIQVNYEVGLSFAVGLRSILRQDPDIVMVGEIRDSETAAIATQAALTGHLVLSTIHTNDAPSAVVRLVDMGIQPYLIASGLIGVIGQRLVRKICPYCIKQSDEDAYALKEFGLELREGAKTYIGAGCPRCFNTGYSGRIAVAEVMSVDNVIRKLITEKASTDDIRENAIKQGMITMLEDGINKVMSGATSLSELIRNVGSGLEKTDPVEV